VTAPPSVEPICVKVNEAARMIGVGRTKLYELIASGDIEVVKLGKSNYGSAAIAAGRTATGYRPGMTGEKARSSGAR